MLGVINRAIPYKGEGFIARINKNLEIKSYFLKAVRLAPELQETHLGLGVFYLKTPFLEGGNLNAAIKELECAAKIAPEFADVNARLAQAYKRRGDTAKSKIYFRRARGLDPDNEILKEIEYSGTSGNKNLYRNERLMMGTFVEVISPNPEAGKIVFNEFRRIESLLSRFDSRSEISQLNRSGSLKVSPETFYIIKKSKEFWQASNGAFDITVAPLEDIWGFTNKQYRVPRKEELACALELTGSDKIILQDIDSVIKFKLPTMQVDLGGIAKGYAIDCAVKKLKGSGVTSCLINAGGQIYCLGDKFSKPWRVALKDPRKKGFTGYLDLKDKSVATSNSYEQYFLKERKRYSHIFNPKTGYPVDNQVISVTVIADDGLTADVLATAIFVLGKNEGEKLAGQFKGVKVRITEKSDVQNN